MKFKTYHLLSDSEKSEFFLYLKTIAPNSPAYSNMWSDNWINENYTLPYILEKIDRFNGVNGEFHLLYSNDDIIACGGVYKSDFSPKVGVAGVRTWVDQKYRHHSLLREYLLPHHKKWCIDNNLSIVLLTFNDYNKNIVEIFKRRRLGEKIDRTSTRQAHHLFYNGINEIGFPIVIQYTKQWGIYEQLDPTFIFDWETIKA